MMLSKQRILLISSVIVLMWIGVGIFTYRSSLPFVEEYTKLFNLKSPVQEVEYCGPNNHKLSPGFWRRVDLHKLKIPESLKESASVIAVQSDSVLVQDVKVHYLHAKSKESSSISVLLLHGQSFTSETWNELGTIKVLSALGYYPIAVDLPGYGKTPSISNINRLTFLDDLISALNLHKPVLISPSMSGSFSLPYLVEHPNKLGGFIPVSPVHSKTLNDVSCKEREGDDPAHVPLNQDCFKIMHYLKKERPNLNCIKVPSLIVWGETDRGENSAKLCVLPESQGAEIPEGKHAAYLSNPELWHKLLYNFLYTLNATQACGQN